VGTCKHLGEQREKKGTKRNTQDRVAEFYRSKENKGVRKEHQERRTGCSCSEESLRNWFQNLPKIPKSVGAPFLYKMVKYLHVTYRSFPVYFKSCLDYL
jgi:hypothetical protein